jgi:hypothetical protein
MGVLHPTPLWIHLFCLNSYHFPSYIVYQNQGPRDPREKPSKLRLSQLDQKDATLVTMCQTA